MTKEEILAKASEFNKGGCEWLDKCIKGSFDDVVDVELHIIDTYEVNKDGKHYYFIRTSENPSIFYNTPAFLTRLIDSVGEDIKLITIVPKVKKSIGGGKTYREFELK